MNGDGNDETLPAATERSTPVSGDGATVAGSTDTSVPSSVTAPIVIRGGGGPDYRALRPVDPQHFAVTKEIARGGMGRILAARVRDPVDEPHGGRDDGEGARGRPGHEAEARGHGAWLGTRRRDPLPHDHVDSIARQLKARARR
jgi:hypothetical protein